MHEDSKAWGEGWYASMLARVPIYHIGYYLLTVVCVRGSYCTVLYLLGGIRHQLHPVYSTFLHIWKKIILWGFIVFGVKLFSRQKKKIYTSYVTRYIKMHLLFVDFMILTDLDFRFCLFMGYCHNWQWFSTYVFGLKKYIGKQEKKCDYILCM